MIQKVILNRDNLISVVSKASKIMQCGGLIIYPTDTVYGLGVDSTNQQAVNKIFELKDRKEGRGFASIFQSIDHIKEYCHINTGQKNILCKYLPGPYTFLLKPKNTSQLANQLIDQEKGTVGVRIPDHQFTKALARQFAKPFTTTSGNISGLPSPKTAEEVEKYLLKPIGLSLQNSHSRENENQIPDQVGDDKGWLRPFGAHNDILLIDSGQLAGIPSTAVDLTKTPPAVIRQGAGAWSGLKFRI
jgi:L-threonylcarbamoyladenylate synthase